MGLTTRIEERAHHLSCRIPACRNGATDGWGGISMNFKQCPDMESVRTIEIHTTQALQTLLANLKIIVDIGEVLVLRM